MRSIFVLVFFGVILATIAISVRSGLFGRRDPGQPINSAMREALNYQDKLSDADAAIVAQRYAGAHETPMGLRYVIREPGVGEATPRRGQMVTAHFEGRLLDGTVFDSSRDDGEGPFRFQVGTGQVIPGWDEAFLTMKKGEKRTLIVPYWLGYGSKGLSGKIPAKATLVFDVELIDFQ